MNLGVRELLKRSLTFLPKNFTSLSTASWLTKKNPTSSTHPAQNTSIPQILINYSQVRDYKPKTRLRKRCKSCQFVWRNGRLYVECEEHPRHKQFHKKSFLKGFDSVSFGYDPKQTYPV